MPCNELLKQQADSVICVERLDYKNQKYLKKAETGPPVHDVGQPVHTKRLSGQQGWIKDSSRRHHYQGQLVLHKRVTHLRQQKPGKKQTGQTGSCTCTTREPLENSPMRQRDSHRFIKVQDEAEEQSVAAFQLQAHRCQSTHEVD